MGDGECEQNMLITPLSAHQPAEEALDIPVQPQKGLTMQCMANPNGGQSILSMDSPLPRSADIPRLRAPTLRQCLSFGTDIPHSGPTDQEWKERTLATYKDLWCMLDAYFNGDPPGKSPDGLCPMTGKASRLLVCIYGDLSSELTPTGPLLPIVLRHLGWLTGIMDCLQDHDDPRGFLQCKCMTPLREWSCTCRGCSYSRMRAMRAVRKMIRSNDSLLEGNSSNA